MDAEQIVLSRQLTKTGQVTSYRAGDDGITEAGWWRGRINANNKTRFISTGVHAGKLTKDRATGLIWVANGNGDGCNNNNGLNWNDAIDYANALDWRGFTDWRLPNIKELQSIGDYSLDSPAIDETFFPNAPSAYSWSSTTDAAVITNAWSMDFSDGVVIQVAKSVSLKIRCVRGGL